MDVFRIINIIEFPQQILNLLKSHLVEAKKETVTDIGTGTGTGTGTGAK